jgi:hypothetical protein
MQIAQEQGKTVDQLMPGLTYFASIIQQQIARHYTK